jgi:hypothetical protein
MTRTRALSLAASGILLAGAVALGGGSALGRSLMPTAGRFDHFLAQHVAPAAAPCLPSWTTATTPSPGAKSNFLNEVWSAGANDAWAVGSANSLDTEPVTVAEHWDGSTWTVSSTPSVGAGANYLYGVGGSSSSDVWAVGVYLDVPTNRYRTLTLHYTGSSWSLVASPNVGTNSNFLQAVEVVGPSDVWAVGYSLDDVSSVETLILHFNGTAWTVFPSPNPASSGNYLYGASSTASNDVWAVGATYVASAGNLQNLVLHYDGTAWNAVTSPNRVPNTTNLLMDVDAMSGSSAWAVGLANGTDGFERVVLQWNGATWSLSPTSFGPGKLFAVEAVAPGDVWAAGATGLIEHWDGAAWQTVAAPSSVLMGTYFGISALSGGQVRAVGYNTPTGPINKTLAASMCETVVNDSGFVPDSATISLGAGATWAFPSTNLNSHRVRDGQRLGLFDSGFRAAGTSFTFAFLGAGSYNAGDSVTNDRMLVKVAPTAAPSVGGISTQFTITWATAPVAGFLFDVQIKRPGSTSWADWKTGVTSLSATFTPDAGIGQYSFRARIRNASTGRACGYSPGVSITVS